MFGALLSSIPDLFTLMGVFHFAFIVMIALSVICNVYKENRGQPRTGVLCCVRRAAVNQIHPLGGVSKADEND